MNNLNTLRKLHILKAVLAFIAAFFVLLFFGGTGAFVASQDMTNDDIPINPGTIMASLGVFASLSIAVTGVLNFLAAKYIREERNHTFIMVVSALNCISGVLGLLLGIFTIIEIQKADVKELFTEHLTI